MQSITTEQLVDHAFSLAWIDARCLCVVETPAGWLKATIEDPKGMYSITFSKTLLRSCVQQEGELDDGNTKRN